MVSKCIIIISIAIAILASYWQQKYLVKLCTSKGRFNLFNYVFTEVCFLLTSLFKNEGFFVSYFCYTIQR